MRVVDKLIQLADRLDQNGHYKEADQVTSLAHQVTAKGNLKRLMEGYWEKQKEKGLFSYCLEWIERHPEAGLEKRTKTKSPEKFCAWMYKELTGRWPGERKKRKAKNEQINSISEQIRRA